MMTVNEVSKLTGVSIRTLQYYDTIGLLKPIEYTESGYRLYDDTSLERLQQILLFKELEFPLKEIKKIIDAPNFDRNKALEQQIELLTMKKEHLENLISFARGIKGIGVKYMDFKVFDNNNSGELNNTAKEALNKIAKDKLTMTHSHKRTAVDVWEMQPSQTDFDFSENRWLYYDWLTLGGVNSNTPTHTPSWETYGRLKSWIQSTDSFDLYASVFQKNGKTYAAMVMIRW